ncbi:isoprenylcysteine carboxylmethyltransferase family protein [Candidatus Thorarchaeota archaeon]|nr:MAG: isoprenylcysteine carboxylmethyltransferase family protein [Candidatus Thorarchaeota archaeon]
MKRIARKIAFLVFWYVLYLNLVLYLLIPQIYAQFEYQLLLLAMIGIGILDTAIRPLSEKGSARDRYSLLMFVLFLLNPFLWVLAYYENRAIVSTLLPILDNIGVSYWALGAFLLGGIITIAGRWQLRMFGSGSLVIEEEHQLIQSGLYSRIRHPIYLGGLIGAFAMELTFRALLMPFLTLGLHFIVLRGRMQREEELMEEEFGAEYTSYRDSTDRLIPGLY